MCNVNFTVELNHHYNPKPKKQTNQRKGKHEHNGIAPIGDACKWPEWAMCCSSRPPNLERRERLLLLFFLACCITWLVFETWRNDVVTWSVMLSFGAMLQRNTTVLLRKKQKKKKLKCITRAGIHFFSTEQDYSTITK